MGEQKAAATKPAAMQTQKKTRKDDINVFYLFKKTLIWVEKGRKKR